MAIYFILICSSLRQAHYMNKGAGKTDPFIFHIPSFLWRGCVFLIFLFLFLLRCKEYAYPYDNCHQAKNYDP